MKTRTFLLGLMATTTVALLIAGCGGAKPTHTPAALQGTPPPDVQATISAQAGAAEFEAPTATPIPMEEREVVLEFVRGHAAVVGNWDRLHADFDGWREGLVACDASAVQGQLRRFAATSNRITDMARSLPRAPVTRKLSDQLIEATEREEVAVRALRDGWTPDDPSVFEGVDVERAAALVLRKEAQDGLDDLLEMTSPDSRMHVAGYAEAVTQLDSAWDDFHRQYDSLRAQEGSLTSLALVQHLGSLVIQLRAIVSSAGALPTSAITDPLSRIMAQAAGDEELALRRLRGTFEKSVKPVEVASEGAQQSGEEGTGPSQAADTAVEITFVPRDPSLFDAFDAQLVKTDGDRLDVKQRLALLLEETSVRSEASVEGFSNVYGSLSAAWDGFHSEYDAWRAGEGGCDRSLAIGALGGFALQFGELTGIVRELPHAAFLRPLGELLVEAAEKEEQALRVLRNTWRPFDAEVYGRHDLERNAANRLRRQVASGIQDLLPRYGITPRDLAQDLAE